MWRTEPRKVLNLDESDTDAIGMCMAVTAISPGRLRRFLSSECITTVIAGTAHGVQSRGCPCESHVNYESVLAILLIACCAPHVLGSVHLRKGFPHVHTSSRFVRPRDFAGGRSGLCAVSQRSGTSRSRKHLERSGGCRPVSYVRYPPKSFWVPNTPLTTPQNTSQTHPNP